MRRAGLFFAMIGAAPAVAQAQGWSHCANENGSCYVQTPAMVRYGAGGAYRYKDANRGFVSCNNATFGDPAPNVVKTCAVQMASHRPAWPPQSAPQAPPAAASAWVACGQEHDLCFPPYPTTVRYGANGVYVTRSASGKLACNNADFGRDPVPNVRKSCAYRTR